MSRLQILSMKPKSPPPPELRVTPPQPERDPSDVIRGSTPRSRPGSQPPPPEIHVEFEESSVDTEDEEEEVFREVNPESGNGKRNRLPAPTDLTPKKLSRSASIVSFVQIPGETKMRMIVSPDGKIPNVT